jgi:hypothetical protein
VLETIVDAVLKIACGVLLRRVAGVGGEGTKALANVVVWLTLPLLLFSSAAHMHLDALAMGKTALCGAAEAGVGLVVALLVIPRLERTRARAGVLIIAAGFGNTIFLGYPIVSSLYGSDGLARAIAFDQLATLPLFVVAAAAIGRSFGGAGSDARRASSTPLLEVLRFPPLWGTAAGLLWAAFAPAPPAGILAASAASIGGLTTTLVLLVVGLQLELPRSPRELLSPALWLALVLRLVVCPLVAFAVAHMLALDALSIAVVTIVASTPVLLSSSVICTRFGLDERLNAHVIALSTALWIVALPAIVAFATR